MNSNEKTGWICHTGSDQSSLRAQTRVLTDTNTNKIQIPKDFTNHYSVKWKLSSGPLCSDHIHA